MVYPSLGRLLPKKLLEKYRSILYYANLKVQPEKFAGFIFFFGIAVSFAIAFDLNLFFKLNFWWVFGLSFLVLELFTYFWIVLRADQRARYIEKMLPDALQLMASNLRSGLTTDKALLQSSRPEFGPLKEEIDKVGREVIIGKDFPTALFDMTKRVKSEKFTRTVSLLVSGIRSGGELASLLTQTAKNLRQQEFVQQRIRANVLTYVIFIIAAVGFGAPLLFGLSSFLVEVLSSVINNVQLPTSSAVDMPITLSQVPITPDFVLMYIIIFLLTTSTFASLIIGLIRWGKEKEGLKYVPLVSAFTILVFFLARYAIKNMIGGMFTL